MLIFLRKSMRNLKYYVYLCTLIGSREFGLLSSWDVEDVQLCLTAGDFLR